eukprot:480802-Amphidinium_carterae.1
MSFNTFVVAYTLQLRGVRSKTLGTVLFQQEQKEKTEKPRVPWEIQSEERHAKFRPTLPPHSPLRPHGRATQRGEHSTLEKPCRMVLNIAAWESA